MNCTFVIPTLNEERNLRDCVGRLEGASHVVVFDSGSTDATVAIAEELGADVVTRPFDNFSAHKNWILDNYPFRTDWVFFVDADERAQPELMQEVARIVQGQGPERGYYVARKNVFMGTWVRHAGMYPDWQLRLFRHGEARYEDRIVHEHMVCREPTGYLRTPLHHEDYKGIERYAARLNEYSTLEAIQVARDLRSCPSGDEDRPLSRYSRARRRLKYFSYRYLPLRSFLVFVYMYVVRAGLLDGRVGLYYCLFRAYYELQVDLKLCELRDPDSVMAHKFRARFPD